MHCNMSRSSNTTLNNSSHISEEEHSTNGLRSRKKTERTERTERTQNRRCRKVRLEEGQNGLNPGQSPISHITYENLLDVAPLTGDCSGKVVRRGRIGDSFYIDLDFGVVVTKSDEHFDPEFDQLQSEDQAEITVLMERELRELGFLVPETFQWNREERRLLVEDLGGTRLCDIPTHDRDVPDLWRELIDQLIKSYNTYWAYQCDEDASTRNKFQHIRSRIYEAGAIQRELDEYLSAREAFLLAQDQRLIDIDVNVDINSDVDDVILADRSKVQKLLARFDRDRLPDPSCCMDQGRVPCHRDLQTYNIMVWRGHARVIDIQDACLGPIGYDLASLLWDPKYEIPDALRESLLRRYVDGTGILLASLEEWVSIARRWRLFKSAGRQLHLYNKYGRPENLSRTRMALEMLERTC